MTLREAVRAAAEALDPQHQGTCWPDPVEWDGRPLREQGADLLVVLEVVVEVMDEGAPRWAAMRAALQGLRAQLHPVRETGGAS